MPATRDLLTAWEHAATLPVTDRAASLVGLWDGQVNLDRLSVGQCDVLLYELRRRLFGDLLDAVARCPSCGEEVSFPLRLSEVQPELGEPPDRLEVSSTGYSLTCRVVRNDDLRALVQLGEAATELALVGRCLLSAIGPGGEPVSPAGLPDEVVSATLTALADADPAANVLLAVSCPCGNTWTDQLDIRAVVWSDLQEWATQLLHDVHALATSYGWSERDILELSPWRRSWYQEASGW